MNHVHAKAKQALPGACLLTAEAQPHLLCVQVSKTLSFEDSEIMSRRWKVVLVLSLVGNLFIVYVAYKALDYRAHVNVFLDKYTGLVANLSGRAEYADANTQLGSPIEPNCRVVFFGSQVIKEWDLGKYFINIEAVNRGVDHQRIAGMLLRFRQDVLDLSPRAVVIEVSSYHFRPTRTLHEIEDYVASMVDLARAHNIEPILTTVIPPRSGAPDEIAEELGDYALMDSLTAYGIWLESYCSPGGEKSPDGVKCVDIRSALSDSSGFLRSDVSAGAIDPNDEGYRLMSAVLVSELDQLFADTIQLQEVR